LSEPQDDGQPLRVHYDSLERQTGKKLYDRVECPELAVHVWDWFLELHSEFRDENKRLRYREILDWQHMTGNRLEPWELQAIRALDRAMYDRRSKSSPGG
jgi:hypothetical protein